MNDTTSEPAAPTLGELKAMTPEQQKAARRARLIAKRAALMAPNNTEAGVEPPAKNTTEGVKPAKAPAKKAVKTTTEKAPAAKAKIAKAKKPVAAAKAPAKKAKPTSAKKKAPAVKEKKLLKKQIVKARVRAPKVYWTETDDKYLTACVKAHIPLDWIDRSLGRQIRSAANRVRALGLPGSGYKGRVALAVLAEAKMRHDKIITKFRGEGMTFARGKFTP